MSPIKSSKKGFSITLEQAVGLIIVVLAMWVGLYIFQSLYGMFTGNPDKNTIENFNYLSSIIKNLKEGEEKEIPFYIDDDHSLVAFGKNQFSVKSAGGLKGLLKIGIRDAKRPKTCDTTKTCLCLCDSTHECEKYANCKTFEGIENIEAGNVANNAADNPKEVYMVADHYFTNAFRTGTIKIKKTGTTLIINAEKRK